MKKTVDEPEEVSLQRTLVSITENNLDLREEYQAQDQTSVQKIEKLLDFYALSILKPQERKA